MFLPEDRLHVAADEVENNHTARKTEDAGVQEHRAEKLPGIRAIDATIAEAQVVNDDGRLIGLENLLCNENGEVNADQRQKDDALARRPARRVRRSFSARQAHTAKYRKRFALSLGIKSHAAQNSPVASRFRTTRPPSEPRRENR